MSEKRVETIDVFRGIAILLVVLFHFTSRLPPEALNVIGTPAPQVPFGWIGVHFFFAISGYCIYLTLEKSATVQLFLARRFSRIYPAFFAAVVFLFLYGLLAPVPSVPSADFHGEPLTLFDVARNFVFLGDGGWVNGSFWSIAVEVKFYVLLAIMAVLVPDRARLAVLFSWVALAVVPFWIVAVFAAEAGRSGLPRKLTELLIIAPYLPFFAVGILARMRFTRAMPTDLLLTMTTFAAIAVIALSAWQTSHEPAATAITTLVGIGLLGMLIAFADHRPIPHIPYLSGGLARIGLVSYSWYLIHENLGVTFLANLNRFLPSTVSVVLAMGMTLLIAWVFSELVEWRFRKPAEKVAMGAFDWLGSRVARLRSAPLAEKRST
ncbi:MAG TPA: acyltransferase [Devosia sp.]|nr:acyltransferase [Devosia sp.]